jgi:hypothetical protein
VLCTLPSHLLDHELLDAQVKILVVVLVEHRVQEGVDLALVLPAGTTHASSSSSSTPTQSEAAAAAAVKQLRNHQVFIWPLSFLVP